VGLGGWLHRGGRLDGCATEHEQHAGDKIPHDAPPLEMCAGRDYRRETTEGTEKTDNHEDTKACDRRTLHPSQQPKRASSRAKCSSSWLRVFVVAFLSSTHRNISAFRVLAVTAWQVDRYYRPAAPCESRTCPPLLDLPTKLCVEDVMQLFKGGSSHWINESNLLAGKFGWGRGYGVFSVSHSGVAEVAQ
jgi:hypothetical protein